ncbi:MAG: Ig domain-containing protein [Deltaproteobacteria bacterium]|nr:Ig domain-containing protein [Deltaproteobacteria bacterium]
MRHRGKTTFVLAAAVGLSFVAVGCGDDNAAEVSVSISGKYSVEIGKKIALTASTKNGTDSAYTWKSSDEKVATVDGKGEVTGVAAGEAEITATGADSKAAGTHGIVVIAAGTGKPTVILSGDFWVKTGNQITLTATTVNGTDSSYTWKSSDETVATVDKDGKVTGVSDGQVTIEATGADSGEKGTIGITVATEVPNLDSWSKSGHSDTKAEAFRHWDAEDPAEVPTTCAKCHSADGFRDFIGDDGSAAGSVEKAVKVGQVIECRTCHNPTASTLATVTFPGKMEDPNDNTKKINITIGNLGKEAICMTCHQGRASVDTVDEAYEAAKTKDANLKTVDDVSAELGFKNIHYYPAAATLNAGRVRGGYQYAGKAYDWRFRHVPGYDTCIGCHDAHTLEVKVESCKGCHTNVTAKADIKKIRMQSSLNNDYDGDGNTTEGVGEEVEGLKAKLLTALYTYGEEVIKKKICYNPAAYPYFFVATKTLVNNQCDPADTTRYDSWTQRLVQAAYNYQMVNKDPGGLAHNAKYMIQLMYDSITDLNSALTTKVDMANARRNDRGHFNGAGEAARHWDEDEAVSASCSRCHSGSEGFAFFVQYKTGKTVLEQDNGIDCATCHPNTGKGGDWGVRQVTQVLFPGNQLYPDAASAATLTKYAKISLMCSTCHAGREGGSSIQAAIDADAGANKMGFINVHYKPAGAVLLGSEVGLGAELDTKTYMTKFGHINGSGTSMNITVGGTAIPGYECAACHQPTATNHLFVIGDQCNGCHGVTGPEQIRPSTVPYAGKDFDGDGNKTESLHDELQGMAKKLYAQMLVYAKNTVGTEICHAEAYPYFFKATKALVNDACDPADAAYANAYKVFDAKLLRAAHHYQIWLKDPGAYAHNFIYIQQLLFDSFEELGGNVTGIDRAAPAP